MCSEALFFSLSAHQTMTSNMEDVKGAPIMLLAADARSAPPSKIGPAIFIHKSRSVMKRNETTDVRIRAPRIERLRRKEATRNAAPMLYE